MSWPSIALILLLLAIRLPSLVQPAGGDQGLYGYSGQRILAGDVMYRDMWDQKPPAIAFIYAMLWRVWPSEAIVPAADLLAPGPSHGCSSCSGGAAIPPRSVSAPLASSCCSAIRTFRD